ncbi:hypothetical protein JFL43_21865 [Viridibacillus sp. YIM B01967]|uniref:RDD domain-containing protein n=1 Tax=Viridibacillus soli TaxID=2798301 RepID=A0ABS1HD77_9BACL|nr:hypothetical protein [Viridibacillus soli]MBK3497409.1 hypothetical protein [Viridibacillus soli]
MLFFIIGIFCAIYMSAVYSAYKEVRDKNLKVKFNIKNAIFFLIIPAFTSFIHLKIAFHLFRKGNKKEAKFLFSLSTFRASTGTALFLDFMIHSIIVDAVYGTVNIKIKQESKKVPREFLKLNNIKEVIKNPLSYENSILQVA